MKVRKGERRESASREVAAGSPQPIGSRASQVSPEEQFQQAVETDTDDRVGKRHRMGSIPNLGQDGFPIRRRASALGTPAAGLPVEAESLAVEADRDFGHDR